MPDFPLNTPVVVENGETKVEVTVSSTNPLSPGTHRFQLVVADEQGHQSAPVFTTVEVAQPTLVFNQVTPSFGKWGDQVVIQGENFIPDPAKNKISFNGVDSRAEAATTTQLTVRVPQPATTGPLRVTNQFGEAASPLPFIIPRVSVVALNAQPSDFVYDPAKDEFWIASVTLGTPNQSGQLIVVSLGRRAVTAVIQLGRGANDLALAPPDTARRKGVVTSAEESLVFVVDWESRQLQTRLQAFRPAGVAIAPDGRLAFVTGLADLNTTKGLVSVIDLADARVIKTISVGQRPTRVLFGHKGTEVFVANSGEASVSVINVARLEVSDTIRLGDGAAFNPLDLAVSVETYPVWTANGESKTASIISKDRQVVNATLEIQPSAVAAALTSSQGYLVSQIQQSRNFMSAITDRSGPPAIKTITIPAPAAASKSIVLTPDDRGIVIAHPSANAASVFSRKDLRLQALVSVSQNPIRCLVTPDNKFACVICSRVNALSLIEMESVLP